MKAIVIDGSPKIESDTMVVTNSFLNGLIENSDSEIEAVKIILKKINPCYGCFKCWKN
ncbi:MAG: hypothetical protein SOV26_02735 [Candidatus Onthovivens sp.]|nr:hypothetical protein [Candidatus Onthovivens sp.]